MKKIKILIVALIMLVCMVNLAFAQADLSLTPDNVEIINDTNSTSSLSQGISSILSEQVASILATLLYLFLGWICFLIRKHLKIKVMRTQVIGFIIRQAEELESSKADNKYKRDLVVSEIKKDKQLSKWAKILYGGLDEAVSTIYKQFVKNSLKNVVKQINKIG